MTVKRITYCMLRKAIEISFFNDKDILSLYDPSESVKNIDQVVCSIYKKISTYNNVNINGVYQNGELIGYFVHDEVYLISFAIAVKFRVRKYLREFFSVIKRKLGGRFKCFLFTKNKRAIKWLSKMGMVINYSDNNITQLQCH